LSGFNQSATVPNEIDKSQEGLPLGSGAVAANVVSSLTFGFAILTSLLL
jgi:hypothetical protein